MSLCPSDGLVVRVSLRSQGESVDPFLLVESPCLSVLFSLSLHLRGSPPLGVSSDSYLGGVLIQDPSEGGHYPLGFLLDLDH